MTKAKKAFVNSVGYVTSTFSLIFGLLLGKSLEDRIGGMIGK